MYKRLLAAVGGSDTAGQSLKEAIALAIGHQATSSDAQSVLGDSPAPVLLVRAPGAAGTGTGTGALPCA